MRLPLALGAAALAVMATGATANEKFQPYGAVEGWNVFIDTEKKSCLIEATDDFGNVVQMGLTNDRAVAYIGVFTKAETNIKKDEKEAVAVLLGDKLYVGEATGMRGNITKDYSGGYILTDDPEVIDRIAKEHVMTVFPEKEYSFSVNLKGTFKAIEAARKCNSEQLG